MQIRCLSNLFPAYQKLSTYLVGYMEQRIRYKIEDIAYRNAVQVCKVLVPVLGGLVILTGASVFKLGLLLIVLLWFVIHFYSRGYILVNAADKSISVYQNGSLLMHGRVQHAEFSWHYNFILLGQSRSGGSVKRTSSNRVELQAYLVLEDGKRILILHRLWPWSSLPANWEYDGGQKKLDGPSLQLMSISQMLSLKKELGK